ncbi:hypothetical protein [Rhodovulum sp. FJ3]|uniref:hypothetical protein n=1 Tax=Rhodovulum sp. FJ3 TaxID=3079053 RepID=UPI00293DE898|nr:hypothetical protein [Rhodovulum sp. FJ3]MDV4166665.1 hypothetical protein [Rhodovulum sp. FJ3]
MADEKHNLITWLGLTTEPDFSKARWLGRLISVVFIALYLGIALTLILGLWWTIVQVPKAAYDAFFAEEPQTARWLLTSTAALTAVTTAVVALPFTVFKTIYNRRQTDVAEQNHVTDQINKAVENLGATRQVGDRLEPNIEVRIGGLLALARIAKANRNIYCELMEIVAAYLVENLRKDKVLGKGNRPRADISRALGIVSERDDEDISFEKALGWKMNLNDIDFRGLFVERVRFRYVDMHQADFRFSRLADVEFSEIGGRAQEFDLALLENVQFNMSQVFEFDNATFQCTQLVQVSFTFLRNQISTGPPGGGNFFHPKNFAGSVLQNMMLPPIFPVTQGTLSYLIGDSTVEIEGAEGFPTHWPTRLRERVEQLEKGAFRPTADLWPQATQYDGRRQELKELYQRLWNEIGFDDDAPTG